MAIGPEADKHLSGRVVVIAGGFGSVGSLSVLFGAGPVIKGTDPFTQIVGVLAIAAGGVMAIGGIGLMFRRPRARVLGLVGGAGGVALGLVIVGGAAASLGGCPGDHHAASWCHVMALLTGAIGIAFAALAVAAMNAIRSIPFRYWRRPTR